MIIGICGLIGSGKGSVADILVEEHNFKKISFADKLKDGVASVFDWDRQMLEGDTNDSRKWREEKDDFWLIRWLEIWSQNRPNSPKKRLMLDEI